MQGKKATDEAINNILAQVDLLNYAKRKPNELSGGQKQRVAIARALVKDPEIIMADEPTGALDSNTGKQIFDTLKELSKEKLVLIVSHDRDFAERYADRIVELADGHIIEDVTKHEHQAERVSDGVHRINDHILRIESGYKLTAKDLDMINAYLAKNNGDVLLSGDGRVNEELRSAAGISKDGATTVFEHTNAERDIKAKSYNKDNTKFIRSRLPMKNAVKMGASGLKHKKFRLFMTILLSFISFAMFGLSSTVAAYEQIAGATASMLDSNVRNASITASVRHTSTYSDRDDVNHWYNKAGINEEDIAKLNAETGLNFVPVYTGSIYGDGGFALGNYMDSYKDNDVYTGQITGFVSLSREELEKTGYTLTGEWADDENEIVITELLYRQFKEYGFKNTSVKPNEAVAKGSLTMDADATTGIIGKHLTFQGKDTETGMSQNRDLKIVGVVDTEFDYDRYAKFLPQDENTPQTGQEEDSLLDMVLANELQYEIGYGFHALAFTTEKTITAIASANTSSYIEVGTHMSAYNYQINMVLVRDSSEGNKQQEERSFSRVAKMSNLANLGEVEWLDGRTTNTLGEKEILLPASYKNMLEVSETEITLSDAQVAALAAIYGEEYWNAADPQNDSVNFMERLEMAAVLKYMDDSLANIDGLTASIENNIAEAGLNCSALEYWKRQWFEESNYYYPYFWVDSVDIVDDYHTVKQNCAHNAAFIAFAKDLLGYDFPADLTSDETRYLANILLPHYYGSDLTHTFGYDDFSWTLREIVIGRDVEQKKPWENEKMVELLIGANYDDIDSLTAWNSKEDAQKQSIMRSFYMYNYISDSQYEAYYGESGYIDPVCTSDELYDLCRQMIMHASGKTAADILSGWKIEFREYNYETQNETVMSGFDGYTVAGFFSSTNSNDVFVSDTFAAYYTTWESAKYAENNKDVTWHEETAEHTDGIWAFAIAPMPTDEETVAKLAAMHYAEEGYDLDVKFQMNNAVMATLGQFDDIIEVVSQVFLWVGLGLAIFSAFLLMNFIATSISYKKREIGILRAVGARSSDVFKIFFSEAFIIAMINFVLAVAASLTTVIILNTYMRNQGINITLLSFGALQVLIMLGLSILVAALASFLPVYSIAKKKPVDAIKDR